MRAGLATSLTITLPATLPVANRLPLLVRKTVSADTAAVASLIRRAFSYWPTHGVFVSPARQTEEKTWEHLARGGYVFIDPQNSSVPLATVTAYPVNLAYNPNTSRWVLDVCDGSTPVSYDARSEAQHPSCMANYSMLLFEKLAVDPTFAQRGIGTAIYRMLESVARQDAADGLVIETVAEATWLYQWYQRLGFQVVGSLRYPGSALETLLMIHRPEA